jgi:non-specific serine/threonine protein kinase/serine/threonine-protein kinase
VNDPVNRPSSNPHGLETPSDPDATAFSPDTPSRAADSDLDSIGPYRLLAKLGEGGMGAVWLAEQTSPVRRQVAIKVVRSGRLSDQALQRFDLERQSLAIMNHPAIAKIFDAGSTAEGQPYFVMEFVSGPPITTYCDEKRLGPRERVALMIEVCEGVQHAHQKAIMHRDLKPSNILVTEVDGHPVPRIIDFGIAKVTQATVDTETLAGFTQAGGMVGTLGYMSPEQAAGALDVDTRTDVYSLGVVLYELLTGSPPFDVSQWKTRPLHEVLRELREEDPPRPSTRVSTGSSDAAEHRGTDLHKLTSQLRGDLDWITLKALERERERRYSSPSDLAADLARYLRDDLVTARPPTLAYSARKFVRRNRLAVAFTAAFAAVIVGFAISMTIERNRARREAETSKRVADFMTRMFEVSDPSESRGNAITAREILDKASTEIEHGLGQDPQVKARLIQIMGNTYFQLGLYARARTLLEQAVASEARVLGPDAPETLLSTALLGVVLESEGRHEQSERLLRKALDGQQRVLGRDHPDTMKTVSYLTDTLTEEGKYAEAEGFIRRTLADQQRTLGPEHGATLRSMRSLTSNLKNQGRVPEAEKLGRDTLALEERALGPDHPGTLWSKNLLALTLQEQGRYADAETLFHEVLAVSTRVLGPDHRNTRAALANVGLALQLQGRLKEAESLQREELDRARRVDGPEHPNTVASMMNLAITWGQEGKLDESEKLLRQALEIAMRTLGPTAPGTRRMMGNLATTLAHARRADEAIALFEKLLQNAAQAEGTAMIEAHYQYAGGMAILERFDAAFQHLEEAVARGFDAAGQLTSDDDLKELRNDPRFQALVDRIHGQQKVAVK